MKKMPQVLAAFATSLALTGAQAQALMLDRYSIDRLVSDLDSLYRALLVKKKRSGKAAVSS